MQDVVRVLQFLELIDGAAPAERKTLRVKLAWLETHNVCRSEIKKHHALVLGSNPRKIASSSESLGVCLLFSLLSELRYTQALHSNVQILETSLQ